METRVDRPFPGWPARRRGCATALAALAVASALGASSAVATPRSGLIVEGRSIAGLALGDTRARALAIFGRLSRCTRGIAYAGSTCELSISGRTVATFDGFGRVVAISTDNRLNVSQRRIVPSTRFEVYATRRGVGGGLMAGRLRSVYGARLRKAPGPGLRSRPPLFVAGPAGALTAFDVAGSLSGGQVDEVTVARSLAPTLAVTPAAAGPGSVVHVAAQGLLPGEPYRLSLALPGHTLVLMGSILSGADGTVALDLPYDGPLTETLLDALPPGTAPPPGTLRLDALDAPGDDGEVPAATDRRPFWLGPLRIQAPLQLAAVTPTITVDGTPPIDLSQGITVRLGGVRPAAIGLPGTRGGYAISLDACRTLDLTGPVQDGVLAVPAAVTVVAQTGIPCTRGASAPTVRTGTITLTRGGADGNQATIASAPISYRVDTR